MNLRIVNKGKFVRSILLIFLLLIGISFVISNKSLSHTETKFKTIYVSGGDTLWSIAKQEQESNTYYSNKDVRSIVEDIKQINAMKTSDLRVAQELKIRE